MSNDNPKSDTVERVYDNLQLYRRYFGLGIQTNSKYGIY